MQLCCVFVLLFAQHGALTHAVWHAHQSLPSQQQRSDDGVAHDQHAPETSSLCVLDAAFGQVLNGVPGNHHPPASQPA